MFAGAYGSVQALDLLLNAGADVNAKSRTGRTALIITAIQNGSDPVVQMLLSKGADPLAVDTDGQSFLLAASKGFNPRQVRLAVQKGADVNLKDRSGMTALMNAAQVGDVDSVKFLLSKGVDVNATSNLTRGSSMPRTGQSRSAISPR
jgi:ankyrin repeat protein